MNGNQREVDVALDLCRDRCRRAALAALARKRQPMTVSDLTSSVLEYDRGTSETDVPDEVSTRIQLSLIHWHLPRLESASVVDYDRDRRRVEPTERLDRLRPHLSAIVDLDPEFDEPIELRDSTCG